MILFSIGVSILTAPINLLIDFLFIDILSAPTIESLNKVEKIEERAKIRVGVNRNRIERTTSNTSSQSNEMTNNTSKIIIPLDFNFKETRVLPPQTHEAQFFASVTSVEVISEVWKNTPDCESPIKRIRDSNKFKCEEIDEEKENFHEQEQEQEVEVEQEQMEEEEEEVEKQQQKEKEKSNKSFMNKKLKRDVNSY